MRQILTPNVVFKEVPRANRFSDNLTANLS